MYLFDASSIVNLVKRGMVRVFTRGATLDLARYEALNAVWEEYRVLGRIDEQTALEFAEIISRVLDVIKVESVGGLEAEALKLAAREGITVYDASYLLLAARRGQTLVTDDSRLRSRASKYVRVLTSKQLAEAEGAITSP